MAIDRSAEEQQAYCPTGHLTVAWPVCSAEADIGINLHLYLHYWHTIPLGYKQGICSNAITSNIELSEK